MDSAHRPNYPDVSSCCISAYTNISLEADFVNSTVRDYR